MKLKEKLCEEYCKQENLPVGDFRGDYEYAYLAGFDQALQLAAKVAFEMGSVGTSSKISKLGEIEIGEDKIS